MCPNIPCSDDFDDFGHLSQPDYKHQQNVASSVQFYRARNICSIASHHVPRLSRSLSELLRVYLWRIRVTAQSLRVHVPFLDLHDAGKWRKALFEPDGYTTT